MKNILFSETFEHAGPPITVWSTDGTTWSNASTRSSSYLLRVLAHRAHAELVCGAMNCHRLRAIGLNGRPRQQVGDKLINKVADQVRLRARFAFRWSYQGEHPRR